MLAVTEKETEQTQSEAQRKEQQIETEDAKLSNEYKSNINRWVRMNLHPEPHSHNHRSNANNKKNPFSVVSSLSTRVSNETETTRFGDRPTVPLSHTSLSPSSLRYVRQSRSRLRNDQDAVRLSSLHSKKSNSSINNTQQQQTGGQQQEQEQEQEQEQKEQEEGKTAPSSDSVIHSFSGHRWIRHFHRSDSSTKSSTSTTPAITKSSSLNTQPRQSLNDIESLLDDKDDELNIEDLSVDISWVKSFPLFGFSPRDPNDARYKAIAKFKSLTSQYGIDDLQISDYLMAISVYTSLIDRITKRTSASQLHNGQQQQNQTQTNNEENRKIRVSTIRSIRRKKSKLKNFTGKHVNKAPLNKLLHPFRSQALPSLVNIKIKDRRFRYWASSVHTLPPDSPRSWSLDNSPPLSPSDEQAKKQELKMELQRLKGLIQLYSPNDKNSNDSNDRNGSNNSNNSNNRNDSNNSNSNNNSNSIDNNSHNGKQIYNDSIHINKQLQKRTSFNPLGDNNNSFIGNEKPISRQASTKIQSPSSSSISLQLRRKTSRGLLRERYLNSSINSLHGKEQGDEEEKLLSEHPNQSNASKSTPLIQTSTISISSLAISNVSTKAPSIVRSTRQPNNQKDTDRNKDKKKSYHRRHWSLPSEANFKSKSKSYDKTSTTKETNNNRSSTSNSNLSIDTSNISISKSDDSNSVKEEPTFDNNKMSLGQLHLLYHMLRHAESIYGLPLTVTSAPAISLTRLTDKAIICCRTGVSNNDILMSNFSAKPFLPAFYVALDRKIKAIVVCIRGTANLVDSLTDVAATQDAIKIRKKKKRNQACSLKRYYRDRSTNSHSNSKSNGYSLMTSSTNSTSLFDSVQSSSSGSSSVSNGTASIFGKISSLTSPIRSEESNLSINELSRMHNEYEYIEEEGKKLEHELEQGRAQGKELKIDNEQIKYENNNHNEDDDDDDDDEDEDEDEDDDDEFIKGYGHGGVLKSAYNLFIEIESCLISAISENPDWAILTTGHSLGAATASILSLLIPNAKCVGFGPPPCVTYEIAQEANKCSLSIVNRSDIVPRLSVTLLLPLFATARYIGDMNKMKKSLVGVGLKNLVVDWNDLEQITLQRLGKFDHLHDGKRLFIPGRVFQANQVKRTGKGDEEGDEEDDEAELLKMMMFTLSKGKNKVKDMIKNSKKESEITRVSRMQFLNISERKGGMFLDHAPFSYRMSIVQALRRYNETIVPMESLPKVMEKLIGNSSNIGNDERQQKRCAVHVWAELCTGHKRL